ncbi:MAG TPA: hypothetical protein DCZ95_14310 [Verrucomicrobia bacterium]|nr:MAG: hypothetical protein A2X46_03445 [Lentisphaerae bacterium GWF2_57_35]HBA85257.1 hypothetical protein [Verrucomicrobiota bacterium]
MTYQGKLIQSNNLVNAQISIVARIFTNEVGGTLVYENSNVVQVVDGVYSFNLGSQTTQGSLAGAFRNTQTWIELTIDGMTLQPRERIAAAAYALAAAEIDPSWTAASNGLQTQITAERQNRAGADTALSNEVAILQAVDSVQESMIAQLMSVKVDKTVFNAATNGLWSAIGSESNARGAADASLSNGISSVVASLGEEQTVRAATDTALGLRIADIAFYETNRTAIGLQATNLIDNTCVVRGALYMDGGFGIMYRTNFGSGSWSVKAFAIDHPLDPQNKILRHYCVEGPDVWNIYAGNAVLKNGRAEVQLPDYYAALNQPGSEIYSLTPVGGPSEVWVQEEVSGHRFVLAGTKDVKVSWTLKALRNDPACLEDLKNRPAEQFKSRLTPEQMEADRLQNTMTSP